MDAVEWQINAISNKNPDLFNKLNRSKSHPSSKKSSDVPVTNI